MMGSSSPRYALSIVVILLVNARGSDTANVLLSGGFGEGSHFLSLVPVGKSLVRQGHNVTFFISDEFSYRAADPELAKVFHFEIFPYSDPEFSAKAKLKQVVEIGFTQSGGFIQFLQTFEMIKDYHVETCRGVLSDGEMMKRIANMDALVVDYAWPCGIYLKSYLLRHMNVSLIPLILNSPSTPLSLMLTTAGSPFNPAYQPMLSSNFTSSMNFLERVTNTLFFVAFQVFSKLVARLYADVITDYDLHPDLKSSLEYYDELTDLYLMNADFAAEYPFPLTPKVIAVGGLTARPARDLDEELEDFMQSSGEHGIILFTLGTYFASFFAWRPDVLQEFFTAFGRIPQKVIMQMDGLPPGCELPPNVKVSPWLPQNDILGHAKTRLFIYHGGNNGFQEALYHGVPLIVIPFFGDQIDVGSRVAANGIGLNLDKKELDADAIYHHINEVINDPKYRHTSQRISAIFKDRPMKPADRAAFWVNHVIKHGGSYMRSPVHDLSFMQLMLLDVIVFLAFIVCVLILCLYLVIKMLARICTKKQHVD